MADVVSLLIFDETNQNCRILQLDRDTMLKIPVLGIGGKYAGDIFGQLALSHSYGSGLEDSCENTRTTVSNFLYGLQIDYYMSMTMDAIRVMTDAVGGVKVNVTDDFSKVDPTIAMGEVTLNGEQAINFVRTRKDVADQMNKTRMVRHETFMKGLMEALKAKLNGDEAFALSLFEDIAPYIVTDCSGNVITSLTSRYGDYPLVEIVRPEGTHSKVGDHLAFMPDTDKLDALILRLFYAPK
jgi:LCP family protein required for cell wall assembly